MSKNGLVIYKSFGKLYLYEKDNSLALEFNPILDGVEAGNSNPLHSLVVIPKQNLPELAVVATCFLKNWESQDYVYTASDRGKEILIKLYKDKTKGGDEVWLRIVTGKEEEHRKRIKLTKRDLLALKYVVDLILFK